MNDHHPAALDRPLSAEGTQIHEKWVAEIFSSWPTLHPNTVDVVKIRLHTSHLLEEISKIFSVYPEFGVSKFCETHLLVCIMGQFSTSRAVCLVLRGC